MATREHLYQNIGQTLEVAQRLELELGTWFVKYFDVLAPLFNYWPEAEATDAFKWMDRTNLFHMLTTLYDETVFDEKASRTMLDGVDARDRLIHSFISSNQTAINTEAGRTAMMLELKKINRHLEAAYDFTLLLSEGVLPTSSR